MEIELERTFLLKDIPADNKLLRNKPLNFIKQSYGNKKSKRPLINNGQRICLSIICKILLSHNSTDYSIINLIKNISD